MLSRVIAHVMLQELKSLVFALQSQKSQKALDAILNRWKRNAQRFSFFFLNMREGPFTFSQAKQIDTHTLAHNMILDMQILSGLNVLLMYVYYFKLWLNIEFTLSN